ncbi:MAG: hypothetical protein ABR543_07545 [Gemmatimonadaceae bacterium]
MPQLATIARLAGFSAMVVALPAGAAHAQRRAATPTDARAAVARANQVPITIALNVGGKSYRAKGLGECKHAPEAYIYSVAAAMWSVQYNSSNTTPRNLSLTMWRPASGDAPPQLTIAVNTGSMSHHISTVKGGKIAGAGTVTMQPKNTGGRFEISGKSANGTAIRGTIDCGRFTPAIAEGG